jgi:hypothetical protein
MATEAISAAAQAATRTIAEAALSATKLLADQAAEAATKLLADPEAAKIVHVKGANDHDTLITLVSAMAHLDTKFDDKFKDLKGDIKDLKDGTTKRIDDLESNKLNTVDSYATLYKTGVEKTSDDHEKRIRSSENKITKILTWGSAIIVLLGILEVVFLKFVHF